MKRTGYYKFIALLLLFVLVTSTFAFVACNPNSAEPSDDTQDGKHEHTFSKIWSQDEEYHWNVATCEHKNLIQHKAKHTFEGNVCSVCQYDKSNEIFVPNDGYVLSDDGKYVYFGYYPQSVVSDTTIIAALNAKTKGLPTRDSKLWTDYGYYMDGKQQSFMWYIDVVHNKEKYRGVYFTYCRPVWASDVNTQTDIHGFAVNTVHWFKFEQIKWRILSQSDGAALLMCDSVLDSQAYQIDYYYENGQYLTSFNGAPEGTSAFNYKYSGVRHWLNNDFYNTAFSDTSKMLILTTEVDNGENSVMQEDNPYLCENTFDKVFLLSRQDLQNVDYGFYESMYFDDVARRLKVSAYALAQGAKMIDGDRICGVWWLRSPYVQNFDKGISQIDYRGYFIDCAMHFETSIGVVPALRIQLHSAE